LKTSKSVSPVAVLIAILIFAPLSFAAPGAKTKPPNILFVILDDVGIDQLTIFNPNSPTPAQTPTLDAIAAAGVKFTQHYAMPECSPSRAAFFTGRFPLRTGVTAALFEADLPASQVSHYEVAIPKVLSKAGYTSALIGKYHLGGPENNPDGDRAPAALGWDYFNGALRGVPPSIDTTLGGQYTADKEKYSCGFPLGNQTGACWFQDKNKIRCDDHHLAGYTGQECVALGGIAALDAQGEFASNCNQANPNVPDFTKSNAYYVWPQDILKQNGSTSTTSRKYMTIAQTDDAIDWIRKQKGNRPWMATVSYNAIHTPYQHPPVELYPSGFVWPNIVPENCTDIAAKRVLSDLMLEAMDEEIGRLLVSIGLATRNSSGQLIYDPASTDTMLIFVGDNGTVFTSVKFPYNPLGSKGTVYQTGVLTPLIVSGPLVANPGRSVDHMVNAVDLFQLFAEIAGVDARSVVPSAHVIDGNSMLPYLQNPDQTALRQYNYFEIGEAVRTPDVQAYPCVLQIGGINVCNQTLMVSQDLCEDNNGVWFGPTDSDPNPQYLNCCDVRASNLYLSLPIQPLRQWAMRNSTYKLAKFERVTCDSNIGELEFYDNTPGPLNPFGLDEHDLLTNGEPQNLTPEQMTNFLDLEFRLNEMLNSEVVCHGDGNLDKRVDSADVTGARQYFGEPSWFDFNADATTDNQDLQCISNNLGNDCLTNGPGTACN
jgi:arylsulfatase A-like enzyme